jgi:hypothetical protein
LRGRARRLKLLAQFKENADQQQIDYLPYFITRSQIIRFLKMVVLATMATVLFAASSAAHKEEQGDDFQVFDLYAGAMPHSSIGW